MKIRRFWITQIEKAQDNKTILLFARDKHGNRARFIVLDFMPFFYVDKGVKIPQRPEIVDVVIVPKSEKRSMFGGQIVRITLTQTGAIPRIRDWFHNHGVQTYEADILYPFRFRISRQIYEGFTVPVKVFDREPLSYDKKPIKKRYWWTKEFVPVYAAEVCGF